MASKSKQIGTRWERELSKVLAEHADTSRRIPGSGAIGTITGTPGLTGDVVVTYPFLNRPIKIECKYGYGGSKSMSVKREWMEKIRQEAEQNNNIPAVSIKFRDVTSGDIESAKWICFSVEDWNALMGYFSELFDDLEDYWSWKYETKEWETPR